MGSSPGKSWGGTNPDWVKPKTMKLVLTASLLSTQL